MSGYTVRGKLRPGRKVGRTLYIQLGDEASDDDTFVGAVDTPELAEFLCEAHNAYGCGLATRLDPCPMPLCSSRGPHEHTPDEWARYAQYRRDEQQAELDKTMRGKRPQPKPWPDQLGVTLRGEYGLGGPEADGGIVDLTEET